MSILTDTDLKQILHFDESQWIPENSLLIKGGSENCITPMGYDLRVGGFYKTFMTKPSLVSLDDSTRKKVIIKPGDIALVGTLEQIKLPQDGSISALILSRVSQVSKGLSNISTKIDPGWKDEELLIPVQNFSRDTIELNHGEKLCTIVFFKNESNATNLYKSSSKTKFVKLLAQTSKDSWKREIAINVISLVIVAIFFAAGWVIFGNSVGFAVTVTFGLAIEKIITGLVTRGLGRR